MRAFDEASWGRGQNIFSDAAYSGGQPWGSKHTDAGLMAQVKDGQYPSGFPVGSMDAGEATRGKTFIYRYCECGTRLSRYNQGVQCYLCHDAGVEGGW